LGSLSYLLRHGKPITCLIVFVTDDATDAAIIDRNAGETLATDGDSWFKVYGWED
jgi:hypothetical protein